MTKQLRKSKKNSDKGFFNSSSNVRNKNKDSGKDLIIMIKQGNLIESEKLYLHVSNKKLDIQLIYENFATLIGNNVGKDIMIKYLTKKIKDFPDFQKLYNKLGFTLYEKKDFISAIKNYKKAIEIQYDYVDAYFNLGNSFRSIGELDNSIASFKKAIYYDAFFVNAYNNLGGVYYLKGDFSQAISSFKSVINLDSKYAKGYFNLAKVLKENGDITKAKHFLKNVININPKYTEALNLLGNIYKDEGNIDKASSCYKNAIKSNNNHCEAYNNLGNMYLEKSNYENAISCFKNSLKINPSYLEAYNNLGITLQAIGRLHQAISVFKKAIDIDSNFATAIWNLSYAQLLLGDYKSGWENYEWRDKTNEPILPHARPKGLRWNGSTLNKEQFLLVITEQGLGDTIQYMRYVLYLKRNGYKILFCAQVKLHSLIIESKINEKPLTPAQANNINDVNWIPLISLPRILGVEPNKPIINHPYISVNNTLINKWKSILSNENKPIIGINWQGNKNLEKVYKGRSIELEKFSTLLQKNDIKLLSLQKGYGSEQLDKCSFRDDFVKCQSEIEKVWDFSEIAAIIENCDLIITCDTAVAHLAGGIGKKVLLLLKYIPYWTWGFQSDKTFWYPSMILFRQKEKENWQELIKRVSSEIYKYIDK